MIVPEPAVDVAPLRIVLPPVQKEEAPVIAAAGAAFTVTAKFEEVFIQVLLFVTIKLYVPAAVAVYVDAVAPAILLPPSCHW